MSYNEKEYLQKYNTAYTLRIQQHQKLLELQNLNKEINNIYEELFQYLLTRLALYEPERNNNELQ
jgi:hypothetical protein